MSASLIAINDFRASQGLTPLRLTADLSQYARAHAQWMHDTDRFEHSTQLGSLLVNGRLTAGENIAWMSDSSASTAAATAEMEVMWENSPLHRENMVGAYTEIGIALIQTDTGWWGVHVFGNN